MRKGVNGFNCESKARCDRITQTTFGGGPRCIWPHCISSAKANVALDVFWTTTKGPPNWLHLSPIQRIAYQPIGPDTEGSLDFSQESHLEAKTTRKIATGETWCLVSRQKVIVEVYRYNQWHSQVKFLLIQIIPIAKHQWNSPSVGYCDSHSTLFLVWSIVWRPSAVAHIQCAWRTVHLFQTAPRSSQQPHGLEEDAHIQSNLQKSERTLHFTFIIYLILTTGAVKG